MLDQIPIDVQLRIINHLSADDVYAVGKVCNDWKVLYENKNVAQKIINRDIEELASVNSDLLKLLEKGLGLNEYLSTKLASSENNVPQNVFSQMSGAVRKLFNNYFITPQKSVIFGPGLENG